MAVQPVDIEVWIDSRGMLRKEIPERCPECGGEIVVEERLGRSLAPVGHLRWLSLDWWCAEDRAHWVEAPIALA